MTRSICLLIFCFLLHSCGSYKYPAKKLRIVVRESNSEQLLDQVTVHVEHAETGSRQLLGRTNPLGFLEFKVSSSLKSMMQENKHQLLFEKQFEASGPSIQHKILLNEYLSFYDVYLTNPIQEINAANDCIDCVADMHYHVSMRSHNLFSVDLPDDEPEKSPDNLNWHKHHKKLRILHEGKWKRPFLGNINFDKNSPAIERKKEKLEILLDGKWVRPKSSNNKLGHYTQATHPHIKDGKVFLAFNAISPFEHNLNNGAGKRIASNLFKSGASTKWLSRIGAKNKDSEFGLTHWENFLREFELLKTQDQEHNSFNWRFLDKGNELNEASVPTVVTVVEGAHILQDTFFPHRVDFDLINRDNKFNERLFERVEKREGYKAEAAALRVREVELEQQRANGTIRRGLKLDREEELRLDKFALVDKVIIKDLERKIIELKKLRPRVHMVTVAHLSYNGMMGHALALDDGKFPANLTAKKVYDLRVSDDPTYQGQWKGLFFSVPGVNSYGKAVMKGLLEQSDTTHRIYIGLKHSDFMTRKYFFDSLMVQTNNELLKDTIPPICSHCAVNGLPEVYYSPLIDEYSLLRSSSTTTFYPFSINIYDEEITAIAKNGGIIGLPLEQRVLGGYINTKIPRLVPLDNDGNLRRKNCKRWKYVQLIFALHQNPTVSDWNPVVKNALQFAFDYSKNIMQAREAKRIYQLTCADYISVEPFLQNLFYILDKTGKLENGNQDRSAPWNHICIGSDLDGIIDPIDICPTASQYPHFKERLRQFIPVFLELRALNDSSKKNKKTDWYFDDDFTIEEALHQLFYKSLKDFTVKHF